MIFQKLLLTDQELLRLRVFDAICKSDSRRRFYRQTILFDNMTVEQATPQREQLVDAGIITQQLCLDEYGMEYLVIEITKKPPNPIVASLIERQYALCRMCLDEN